MRIVGISKVLDVEKITQQTTYTMATSEAFVHVNLNEADVHGAKMDNIQRISAEPIHFYLILSLYLSYLYLFPSYTVIHSSSVGYNAGGLI